MTLFLFQKPTYTTD